MQIWKQYIAKLDATVDPEAVLDWADDLYRIFGRMTEDQWRECIGLAKAHGRLI